MRDTPREMANELFEKMLFEIKCNCQPSITEMVAKKCALIIVEEVLNSNPTWFIDQMKSTHKYWEDVRDCLNNL